MNLAWNNLDPTNNLEVVSKLSIFVKSNQNLLHLDLTSVGLMAPEIKYKRLFPHRVRRYLIKYVKRAQSLLSVHLSGNELTRELKAQICRTLKCIKKDSLEGTE